MMRRRSERDGTKGNESWKRSLTKTITYRLTLLVLHFIVFYAVTRNVEVALGGSLLANLVASAWYYAHERLWSGVRMGRTK